MFTRKDTLAVPSSFDFPFTPYTIQQEFMERLYEVIERKQIGIFESPTGTGKSLTLTCGSLKWLLDDYDAVKAELKKTQLDLQDKISERTKAESGTSWFDSQFETIGLKEELQRLKVTYEYIQKYERKMMELKRNVHKMKKQRKFPGINKQTGNKSKPLLEAEDVPDKLVDSDLELNDCNTSDDEDEEQEEKVEQPYRPAKIFFCSRTHSQLSQVVNEIKGTSFKDRLRVTSLASRQIYCVNDDVRQSGSQSLINERCLDLQKKSSTTSKSDPDGNTLKKSKQSKSTGCPYNNKANVDQLKNEILADVLDIEDLITIARKERACPYYAARAATEDAQIVLLPYQLLLHKDTRLQSGIDIRDAIIIVDEAHNLMDTISAIHSTEITLEQLRSALQQVAAYKTKFQSRFKSSNLLKIKQLEFIIKQLVRILEQKDVSHRMVLGYELMAEAEFFNLDIVKLLKFCDESRFAQKVQGLAQRNANATVPGEASIGAESKSLLKQLEDKFQAKKSGLTASTKTGDNSKGKVCGREQQQRQFAPQVIRPLLAFLRSLCEKSSDGRVLVQCGVKLKYLLLNCGAHFQDILSDCRSIIVAGGTMKPINELTDQLFARQKERLRDYCFGHVVPPDAICPRVVAKGASGTRFLFNFANKQNKELMRDLGTNLGDLAEVVPAGMVVFFCSYDYLHSVHEYLKREGLLERIQRHKDVFIEPKQSGQTEKILHDYSVAVKRRGAMLFSVVGGKLSEGLNFSDDLGRCVVVVGMPYPNKTSPELVQKMQYLDEHLKRGSGNEYYENLCMKAVNQCIGRAVRHIADYAAILLLDERYSQERIRLKLPEWIRISLQQSAQYSSMTEELKVFFQGKIKK